MLKATPASFLLNLLHVAPEEVEIILAATKSFSQAGESTCSRRLKIHVVCIELRRRRHDSVIIETRTYFLGCHERAQLRAQLFDPNLALLR